MTSTKHPTVIILQNNPDFIERGVLWYQENEAKILQNIKTKLWWSDHSLFLEEGALWPLHAAIQRLSDLGYQRVHTLQYKGEYSVQGNVLMVAPVNAGGIYTVNFWGNEVEQITFAAEKLPVAPHADKKGLESLLKTLHTGAYVVHINHGIGIYKGIQKDPDGTEYFIIEYAQGDRLIVPMDLYQKLSLYLSWNKPTIHRLGSSSWSVTKKKVKEDTVKLARDLLELYKQREVSTRTAYQADDGAEKEFVGSFEHLETSGQQKAINETLADLERAEPMDRLVCGDVGFGKTEVALRAAFRVALNGKQVAFMAPTTILAVQHYQNISARFQNFPYTVKLLNRFTPAEEAQQITAGLASGAVDIVVGTHRLLSRDVQFKDLGLVIVDEEQRFGVKQKDAFKAMRHSVDMLSLSATPIPRTLYFSLTGLRDISNIETPPPERIPIKTHVQPFSPDVVKRAILFELERGGHIFYLHNRIETIGSTAHMLADLVPSLRMRAVHSKLPEHELLSVTEDFLAGKFDLLITTTIIENGLDMPNVNTLIVEDATKLGLSQAHQLRGRIGRRNEQAYAYFFYPSREMSEKARERLDAIELLQDLGAGYQIALKDLEIRGAGNILGKEQSGAIMQVGLNLYCQMLDEARSEMEQYNH